MSLYIKVPLILKECLLSRHTVSYSARFGELINYARLQHLYSVPSNSQEEVSEPWARGLAWI